MSDLDLSALRKVAEAAETSERWHVDEIPETGECRIVAVDLESDYYPITSGGSSVKCATHIATFDPPTVLALLDELENARTTIEQDKRHFAKFWDDGYQAGHECVGADPKCRRMQNPHAEP